MSNYPPKQPPYTQQPNRPQQPQGTYPPAYPPPQYPLPPPAPALAPPLKVASGTVSWLPPNPQQGPATDASKQIAQNLQQFNALRTWHKSNPTATWTNNHVLVLTKMRTKWDALSGWFFLGVFLVIWLGMFLGIISLIIFPFILPLLLAGGVVAIIYMLYRLELDREVAIDLNTRYIHINVTRMFGTKEAKTLHFKMFTEVLLAKKKLKKPRRYAYEIILKGPQAKHSVTITEYNTNRENMRKATRPLAKEIARMLNIPLIKS